MVNPVTPTPTREPARKWLVTTDDIKRKFGWDFLGVIRCYASTNGEHNDRVLRCLSDEFRMIPNTNKPSIDDELEWHYWLEDTIRMDKDFADILADPELVAKWRGKARIFDNRPTLKTRFFHMLRQWSWAWQRRLAYRRGRAEAHVIIDQYRNSPDKYINGVTLQSALLRRREALFENSMNRLSVRAGFDSERHKQEMAIWRIMNRNTDG